MSHFEDLQPCTRIPGEWTRLLAVGWLAKGHQFPRRKPDPSLVRRLDALLANPWAPGGHPHTGTHWCDLCAGGYERRRSFCNLFIPTADCVLVAPSLITHYIARHRYAPPAEFIEAVLACPEMGSPEYLAQIRHHHALQPTDAPRTGLEPLDPVRRRPGMYIGGTDSAGLTPMLFELVSNSIDQHLAGIATALRIEIDPHGWVEVEDDGPGLPVETTFAGMPAFEAIFTRLHFGPTLDDHHPHIHARAGAAGVGAAVVSALSSRFEVETWRKGSTYSAVIERGQVLQPLVRGGPTERHGTRIRYRPDERVFEDASHDVTGLEQRFKELGSLLPRLDLRFQGRSMRRPDGLSGWLAEIAPDTLTETRISVVGSRGGVDVEVALGWAPAGARRLRSFVNFGSTIQGGSHVEGLVDAIRGAAPTRRIATQVLTHLAGLVHVRLLHPRFQGPIRAQLDVETARLAVVGVVGEQLKSMPWWWDRVLEAMR